MRLVGMATAAAVLLAALAGCAAFNDISAEYHRHTSIGRELMDLKEAYEKGALTDEEYGRLRKEIMEGGPVKTQELEEL